MPRQSVDASRLEVGLITGDEAQTCLADPGFQAEWSGLWDRCPWATPFQAPAFAANWYRTYRDRFQPVLVVSRGASGELNGLLTLARPERRRRLVAAGSHQAEYQVWLSTADLGEAFPLGAFALLRRRFPGSTLGLSYLPAEAPLGWRDDREQRGLTDVAASRRPFLELGSAEEAERSLRKPGNKSRLRQLRKLGPVEFRRVTDPAEFGPLLDRFAVYHDCRQSASHGSTPFRTDPRKHAFHLALMNAPGLLHVTVLTVGDQVASAHLNMIRGSEVQLSLIAHNPELERLSPGKLHIHFLAGMLAEQGYTRLDLTPGGEDYKERFANGADTVHSVLVFPSTVHRAVGAGLAKFEEGARPILTRLNLRRARVLALAQKARKLDVTGVASELRSVARACLTAFWA